MKPNNRSERQHSGKRHRSPANDSAMPNLGRFWIAPDLNRTICGPDGNRGEHTTSAAYLLKLAEIALRTRG